MLVAVWPFVYVSRITSQFTRLATVQSVYVRCIWSICAFDQMRRTFDQICCPFGQLRKPNLNPNLRSLQVYRADILANPT